MINIGIDPDVDKSGFSFINGNYNEITTLSFFEMFKRFKELIAHNEHKPTFKIVKFNAEQSACWHRYILVCQETRSIECEQCGIKMSAFDYLLKTCFEEDNAFRRIQQMQIEVEKLEKRYRNLSKEVERLNLVRKQLK